MNDQEWVNGHLRVRNYTFPHVRFSSFKRNVAYIYIQTRLLNVETLCFRWQVTTPEAIKEKQGPASNELSLLQVC
jgi:hypothetical protein